LAAASSMAQSSLQQEGQPFTDGGDGRFASLCRTGAHKGSMGNGMTQGKSEPTTRNKAS
jgi:hypothetical protein